MYKASISPGPVQKIMPFALYAYNFLIQLQTSRLQHLGVGDI
jgi:hypothetical protein